MATNDFLPFAGGAGANVLTQSQYAGLSALLNGFTSGLLPSSNLNKVLRQTSIMAAMLGQWIADKSGNNVVDDGTIATIEASFTAALATLGLRAASTSQTGVVQLADSTTAQALTDALKAITPATLKAAFQGSNQSLVSAGGYQKQPGGLILQWGSGVTAAGGSAAITYPITFPNGPLAYFANVKGVTTNATSYISSASGPSWTSSGGVFWANLTTAGVGFNWWVLGN